MPPKQFLNGRVTLHCGDCLDVVRGLANNSIDSVCTDPPYALVSIVKRFGKSNLYRDDSELQLPSNKGGGGTTSPYQRVASGFMGKEWDNGSTAFAVEFWAEILRVLKPGGHVAAFSGTRSYHRLACAIEDAGFEIRDQLAWCYGSGFPKSHDVSKGIDKAAGVERTEAIGKSPRHGGGIVGAATSYEISPDVPVLYAPATDAARQWEGWGTALKPSWEPICLARKPISEKTVAANVLRWGTGAINVDGCRVEGKPADRGMATGLASTKFFTDGEAKVIEKSAHDLGRWPANLCHDGSPEVLAAFPETGKSTGGQASLGAFRNGDVYGKGRDEVEKRDPGFGDSGSAARFFYSSKADSDDRIGSKHPTIKPVDLMQWLVRLITPPRGTTLDPFAGTGTTGEAAWREGFNAILIEREAEYQADIERRMKYALGGAEERKHAIIKAKGLVEDAGPLFEGL